MTIEFAHQWVLLMLPISLLPVFMPGQKPLMHAYLPLFPTDSLSKLIDLGLRCVASIAIGTLICAIAGPHRPAQEIERTGQGAQVVLLLDRSRSMDEPFYSQTLTSHPLGAARRGENKGAIARKMLSEFVASRLNDMFGMVVFSSYPIKVLPLTQKQAIIQAAIEAGNIGKGLAETDIGAGLLKSLEFFNDQPYTGSRIVVLVSDGGATLDVATQIRIKNLMRRNRVALYWIYIRSRNSLGLVSGMPDGISSNLPPQQALHEFFLNADVAYRAYTAENPEELQRAIADVNRLQNLPIRYTDLIPQRDVSPTLYGLAALMLVCMLIAKLIEVRVSDD